MCRECWIVTGSVALDGERVARGVELVERVRAQRHCCGAARGGGLHVVLDDWNVEDESLDWCLALDLTDVERECGEWLRALTVAERVSILARVEGFVVT